MACRLYRQYWQREKELKERIKVLEAEKVNITGDTFHAETRSTRKNQQCGLKRFMFLP